MKRLTSVLLLLCAALPVSASEAFTLTIPLGEDLTRVIGEVRIVLGLSAPPAGSQLVVGGTTTIPLGQTVTFMGDSVTFSAGSGNSVVITYRPLSNFVSPNDFCNTAGASPKDVAMRFSGSQDVVDYRISSYAVGAPGFECSQPFKRVGDFPAFLTPMADGTAPELIADAKGRLPLDVVLVLDKSGSMSELPPDVGGSASKAEILRSAVTTFIAQWTEIDGPMPDTTSDNSEDRLGVVFFDQAAAAQMPAGFFVARGSGPSGPSHPWSAVANTVSALSPGGSTSIGGGLNEGMRQWKLDPDHDLAVVIVTDGKQNTAPLITPDANDILTLTPVSGLSSELRKRFTPLLTVAFGVPAQVDQELLQNLSLQTAGVSFIAIDASTMFNTFATTLVNLLKGNTVSLGLSHNDTLTGAGPSTFKTLIVDPGTPRVVVSLQWAPPHKQALDFEVRDQNGNDRKPDSVTKLQQAVIQTFDVKPEEAGAWRVRVERSKSSPEDAIPYTLTGFLVEKRLEYRFVLPARTINTGDTIPLRVSIAYDHKALGKLPPDAVKVRVQKPAEALGTILHDASGPRGGGGSPAGDVQSPYERKLNAITNASLLRRVMPRDAETITLTESKPGEYTGTFATTSTPGVYAFELELDWNDPRTGRLRRVERVERQVQVKADPATTEIRTARAADGTLQVSVTPRDRFGNFFGPGYASLVSASNAAGTPTDVDQTGTYVLTVPSLPSTITVGGVTVGDAPQPSSSSPTGNWRVFLDYGRNDDDGNSLNLGLERRLSPDWSLELIAGDHDFESNSVTQISLGAKRWFGSTSLHPFVAASAGAYDSDLGASLGGGVLYELSPKLGIEGVYNYHVADERFFTAQLGVRISF